MAKRVDCEHCGSAIDPVSGHSLYDFDVFAAAEASEALAANLARALENLLKLVAPSNVYGERAHSRDARTALAKYRAVVNRG